jgi:hypothetical protein
VISEMGIGQPTSAQTSAGGTPKEKSSLKNLLRKAACELSGPLGLQLLLTMMAGAMKP